ncbi:MAG: sigma-70 family RNA polymerase sigma factor [Ruthenibacterium sp.]
MEEQKLLLQLQQHPSEGIRAAMLLFAPMVKGICVRVLPSRQQDVEECMADVFVALWKNAAAIARQQAPIKAWLAVTARNKAIDTYRKGRKISFVPLKEEQSDGCDAWMYGLSSSDAEDAVQALVAAMTPPDRDIFIRKYYWLQTVREIAAALQISEDSIKKRLTRGREALRKQLIAKGVR